MAQVRTDFSADDSSSIWTLLNPIGQAVNPYIADTGVWNLGAANGTLNGGTTALNGGVYIQRVGFFVMLQGALNIPTGSPLIGQQWDNLQLLGIPTGFKPWFANYQPGIGTWVWSGAIGVMAWKTETSRVMMRYPGASATIAATNWIHFTCQWPTYEDFPAQSSIPGTKVR